MTKEQLESYKSKKMEIKELENRLQNLSKDDSMVGNSTIMDYRSGYPRPQAVIAVDRKRYYRTETRYLTRIQQLEKECDEVEDFIENIEDSMMRRIMRMHYLDGMGISRIAETLHMHKSTISKKITLFLKVSTKSTKETL